MSSKCSIEELKALLDGRAHPGARTGNAVAVRHLLADALDCRNLLQAAGWSEHRLERLLLLSGSAAEVELGSLGEGYAQAFSRAAAKLEAFLAREAPAPASSHEQIAELKRLPESERISRISSDLRYAHARLVRELVDYSHSLRYENPAQMLHWADLARVAADALSPEAAGSEAKLFDLKGWAWGQYGNALRVGGRLREAEQTLATAWSFAQQGTGDLMLRARLLEQRTSLQIFRRNTEQAIKLSEEAGRIYRELGEIRLWAASQVSLATAHIYGQAPEEAVPVLNRAIPEIDATLDPQVLLMACHNLVVCFVNLGMPEHALTIYTDTRVLYQEFEDSLICLRINWEEGRLLRDLGRLETAEEALLKAREGFVARGLAYEVAVVSLDLAAVYVKMGLTEEVRKTIMEALPTFRALQIDRETIASLLQLQQIAGQEAQALSLFRMMSAKMEQFRTRQRDSN